MPDRITIDRKTAAIALRAIRYLIPANRSWAELPDEPNAKEIFNNLVVAKTTLENALSREAPGTTLALRGPMPKQLSMLGCGKHEFEREEYNYRCLHCSTHVHPGQLMYNELREWMGDPE